MVDSVRSKLKIVKIVLWSILGAILLFVLIVVGCLLVDKYIKKSPVPMFAGYGPMIVITGSMSSTINKGDLIIIKRFDEYKITDVVTFVMDDGRVVTHRIVNYADKEAGTFITMGDFNDDIDQLIDPPVSADQIYGKVVATIPHVGLFFDWVLHDYGIIYIVAILAAIVAGVYFWNVTKPDPEECAEASAENSADTSKDGAQTEGSSDLPEEDKKEDNKE